MESSFEYDDGNSVCGMNIVFRKLTYQQLLSMVPSNQKKVKFVDFSFSVSWDLPCLPNQTKTTFTVIAPTVFKKIRERFGVSETDFAVCNKTESNDNY